MTSQRDESAGTGRGPTRRDLLATFGLAGTVGLSGLAGCLGGAGGESDSAPTATSAATDAEPKATASQTTHETRSGSREIIDRVGRAVSIPATVEELIAVGPGALNLVSYLDATDRVVGVEENETSWGRLIPYNAANPDLRERPVVGPHKGGDPALIAEQEPDVVLATYVTAGAADDLQAKTDVPVVVLKGSGHPIEKLSSFYDHLRFAGRVLGATDRASAVVEYVRGQIADLEARTADVDDREPVYLAGRSDTGGAGATSTQHPFAPFQFVHADNVADPISGHAMVSQEQLLQWDPAKIFVSESNLERVKEALSRPKYGSVRAVDSGELYGLLPSRFYGDLYGSVLANAYYVGSVLYPDAFADVTPAETADDLYAFLHGTGVYDTLAAEFGGFQRIRLD
jgi:iron complex transport system substrate-binding protein